MLQHMDKEEHILFHMLGRGSTHMVVHPTMVMRREHEEHAERLQHLMALTRNATQGRLHNVSAAFRRHQGARRRPAAAHPPRERVVVSPRSKQRPADDLPWSRVPAEPYPPGAHLLGLRQQSSMSAQTCMSTCRWPDKLAWSIGSGDLVLLLVGQARLNQDLRQERVVEPGRNVLRRWREIGRNGSRRCVRS